MLQVMGQGLPPLLSCLLVLLLWQPVTIAPQPGIEKLPGTILDFPHVSVIPVNTRGAAKLGSQPRAPTDNSFPFSETLLLGTAW